MLRRLIRARGGQRGFGLVEIMVSLVVGMFLMAGVIQIYLSNKESYRLTEGMSRLQENARFAMKRLGETLQPAGYQGCLGARGDNFVNTLSVTTGYANGVAVTGTEGGSNPDTVTLTRATPRLSIPLTGQMRSQVAAAIQLDASDPDFAQLEQYQVVMISDCEAVATFMITNDPQAASPPDGVIEHATGVVSTGLNAGQSNATLDLGMEFGSQGNSVARVYATEAVTLSVGQDGSCNPCLLVGGVALVEGVQDMQITYGLLSGGNLKFVDASSVSDWGLVQSVRVTLAMDALDSTGGSALAEKSFSRTFRIRNLNP